MNTNRRARGVRGQAEPSMMISAELQKLFENLVNQILNDDTSIFAQTKGPLKIKEQIARIAYEDVGPSK
jgi:hypothetical protein